MAFLALLVVATLIITVFALVSFVSAQSGSSTRTNPDTVTANLQLKVSMLEAKLADLEQAQMIDGTRPNEFAPSATQLAVLAPAVRTLEAKIRDLKSTQEATTQTQPTATLPASTATDFASLPTIFPTPSLTPTPIGQLATISVSVNELSTRLTALRDRVGNTNCGGK